MIRGRRDHRGLAGSGSPRKRRRVSSASSTRSTTPVLSFRDPLRTNVATLGINPSRRNLPLKL